MLYGTICKRIKALIDGFHVQETWLPIGAR
jgi:hypothetical protein